MKKLYKYPSIEQFRNLVEELKSNVAFQGKDKNGKPIYDNSVNFPSLKFVGTPKINGSNCSICFDMKTEKFQFQSRKKILSNENEYFDFVNFCSKRLHIFKKIFKIAISKNFIANDNIVILFGEWAGKGISHKSSVKEFDRFFTVFELAVYNPQKHDNYDWYRFEFEGFEEYNIYNIFQFGKYEIEIDFNEPEEILNKLESFTNEVEKECPVAKYLSGNKKINYPYGEGIVWETTNWGKKYRFKTKSKIHSLVKVKKVATIEPEKLKSVDDFVQYAATENRFLQAIGEVFGDKQIDKKLMGDFIQWIIKDIFKEDRDVLYLNNLTMKDVNKAISNKAKAWFLNNLEK